MIEIKRALKKLEMLDDPINYPITKAEICRLANVKKPFIYKYKDELQKTIDEAIKRQNQRMKTIVQKQNFSDTSKDRLVESLRRRINNLESENKKLKDENKVLYGKLAAK